MPTFQLACIALALVLGACASSGSAENPSLGFETLAQGTTSGLPDPQTMVVRSDYNWNETWRLHTRGRLPVPPTPEVSFQTQMVLGVCLGQRPTAGYAVEIVSLRLTRDDLRVVYRETQPDVDSMQAQVTTCPVHFVRAPHFDGEVVFELEEK